MNKIILLHGWGCDSSSWAPILPQLANLGKVIAIDLPGFGKSPALENYSIDAVVDFIAQRIFSSGELSEPCVLIGWSLGGMLAVQIAARYPQRVSGIITLAANIKFVASHDYPEAMPPLTNSNFTESFANDSVAALKIFSGLLAQRDANERALFKKMRNLISTEATSANWLQALQLLSQLDNRNAFTALTQSGLHLFGAADVLVPQSAAPVLSRLNTRQKIMVLPHAAHALHWSQPEAVMMLMQDFFQSLEPEHVKKIQVAQSFSRAAKTYDAAASFQRDVGNELLRGIEANKKVDVVLDLGCGTGHFTQHLKEAFPQAQIIGMDLAEGMLRVAQEKNLPVTTWVCGDAEKLPLVDASVDIIFSSLALQWCNNLAGLFSELYRVIKPDGALFFSTLGPNTLHELRSAWQQVDSDTHVNHFKPAAEIQRHLLKNSFSTDHFFEQSTVLEFQTLTELTRNLKQLGAHNINRGRATGLTGRKKIAAFNTAYEQLRRNTLLPATYEVFYISAKKLSVTNG
ncbi:MAG: malonyl-ACP O-methyltransferase BioC [Pseudomonadota bacterium]